MTEREYRVILELRRVLKTVEAQRDERDIEIRKLRTELAAERAKRSECFYCGDRPAACWTHMDHLANDLGYTVAA